MHEPTRRLALFLFLLLPLVLGGCVTVAPRLNGDAPLRSETVVWQGRPLHSWRSGRAGAMPLIFVHGSPGDGLSWREFLIDPDLQQHFDMVALDRPGFGLTGGPASDLTGNVAAVRAVLQRFDRPAVLVGHSYGGPLALGLAAQMPDRVHACVLLAAPGAPNLGKTHTLNLIVENSPIKWMLSAIWRSSNTEMLALRRDLTQLQPQLATVRGQVILIHGENDRLVDPRNLLFLRAQLQAATVDVIEVPNQGHFLPWEQFELIKQKLLALAPSPPTK